MHKMAGWRILDGRFMTVNQACARRAVARRGRRILSRLLQTVTASVFLARSIERHKVAGLSAVKRQHCRGLLTPVRAFETLFPQ